MQANRLLDVEEALARAITANKELESAKQPEKSTVTVFPNNVSFSRDQPGLPYCGYCGGPRYSRRHISIQKNFDGNNPIRDFMRLLCRKCLSNEHLLRDCNNISAAKRAQLTQNQRTAMMHLT